MNSKFFINIVRGCLPFHRLAPGKESPFPYNDGNLKSVAALRKTQEEQFQLFANRLHI